MLGFRTPAYVFGGIIQPIAGVLPLRGCDAKSGAAAGVRTGGLGEPHSEVEEILSGENAGWAGEGPVLSPEDLQPPDPCKAD